MVALGSEPLRWLRPLSWVYGLGVRARNAGFEFGWPRVRKLPIPVVSVGNLSVGGTGKTPFVAWFVGQCRSAGLRVGVLARGYGRRSGEDLNDEGRLLAGRFPQLPQEQDGDRYAAGVRLLARDELDLIVLDDGFQHRRLHRDLDVCLLDARMPFGDGLLPAGWLREPASALRRADVCVLTGCDGVDAAARGEARALVAAAAPGKPVFCAAQRPLDVVVLPSGESEPAPSLDGRRVFLLAAIARPERFRASVVGLGAEVVGEEFLRDHARISPTRLAEAAAGAASARAVLLLTEKDEARLALPAGAGPDRCVLRIALEFDAAPQLRSFLPPCLRGQ